MYRTFFVEDKVIRGVPVRINRLHWVDGERTYEVVQRDTMKVVPGGGDFQHYPSDEEIAALLK
ncbi:hypothetical protein [Nonomuraea sp. NPDC049625]|uniref:hypothetical protein n=1 Tax=Nonomuraea sp. NPDC049625 TaxID=3155775 RepID=UPI00342F431B